MSYLDYELPKYPCKSDMWDMLAKEKRPIVVYGMGNGADKLIKKLDDYGVSIADFFASDGFVRGHLFHGKRVLSFSEIKEKYEDFVILLSFASRLEELLDYFSYLDKNYDFYIPDMPVADATEYFDREFFNNHYQEILAAYNSLSDGESKSCFAAMVNYKLTGELKYLLGAYSSKEDKYALLNKKKIAYMIDAGAYNGDTVREAKEYYPDLKEVIALEPDKRNYKKLEKYSEAEKDILIKSINAAAWCEDSFGSFFGSGNRNSSVASTASYEHQTDDITMMKIDSLGARFCDYIKYDVEGAEYEALSGSLKLIKSYRPALLVSLYHKSKDLFSLINFLNEELTDYSLFLRRLLCVPAWELELILIPKEC